MGTPIRPGLLGTVLGTTVGTKATTGISGTVLNVGSAATSAALGAAATRAVVANTVIDIGEAPSKATIVRGGKEVETPTINESRASTILENFIPIARGFEPRGVSQSIVAGTLVTRGTAIDVELLAPNFVTLGLFDGVHADLRALTVDAVAPLLQDPEVVPLLDKQASDLTAAEQQNLTAKLAQLNVTIDNTSPDKSIGAALAGLKSALAFR